MRRKVVASFVSRAHRVRFDVAVQTSNAYRFNFPHADRRQHGDLALPLLRKEPESKIQTETGELKKKLTCRPSPRRRSRRSARATGISARWPGCTALEIRFEVREARSCQDTSYRLTPAVYAGPAAFGGFLLSVALALGFPRKQRGTARAADSATQHRGAGKTAARSACWPSAATGCGINSTSAALARAALARNRHPRAHVGVLPNCGPDRPDSARPAVLLHRQRESPHLIRMADPFAMARADGPDAVLLLAEQRLAELLRQTDSPDSLNAEICALYRLISRTAPATLLGAAVKLRLLLHQELGIAAIEVGRDDLISLRQIADLLERQT